MQRPPQPRKKSLLHPIARDALDPQVAALWAVRL